MVRAWLKRMTASLPNGPSNQRKLMAHTTTALKRWSCLTKDLPNVSQIKAIHVYDFDNTLFSSPLPNQKLWQQRTISALQSPEGYGSGGWWHNNRILAATGEGIEKEEPRGWKGWWNEKIVELVQLSSEQDDALTVLLTGRGEGRFAQLLQRIVNSRKLSFDMMCLKPETGPNNQRISSTMEFKRVLLQDLVLTYRDATEIRVYEDRPHHTRAFREFFEQSNLDLQYSTAPDARKPIDASVIQVADLATSLDPVVEAAEVQRLINTHNSTNPPPSRCLEIKRTVYYTGYLISNSDTSKLLGLVNNLPNMNTNDVKFLANNILISYGAAHQDTLKKVGGVGRKQDWQIIGLGVHQNSIWAARVAPIPPSSVVHTQFNTPYIILAQLKSTPLAHANRIQNWAAVPLDKQYVTQTTVGEKLQLQVDYESDDSEHDGAGGAAATAPDRGKFKRRRSPPVGPQSHRNGPPPAADENRRPNDHPTGPRAGNANRHRGGPGGAGGAGGGGVGGGGRNGGHPNTNRPGRGGGAANRGGGGAGGNKGRGGPGSRGYKSLDDVGNGGGRYNPQRGEPNYDDYIPPGGRGYEAAFPAPGDGGLPYGK